MYVMIALFNSLAWVAISEIGGDGYGEVLCMLITSQKRLLNPRRRSPTEELISPRHITVEHDFSGEIFFQPYICEITYFPTPVSRPFLFAIKPTK